MIVLVTSVQTRTFTVSFGTQGSLVIMEAAVLGASVSALVGE